MDRIILVVFEDGSRGLYKASEVCEMFGITYGDVIAWSRKENRYGETSYTLDMRNSYAFI